MTTTLSNGDCMWHYKAFSQVTTFSDNQINTTNQQTNQNNVLLHAYVMKGGKIWPNRGKSSLLEWQITELKLAYYQTVCRKLFSIWSDNDNLFKSENLSTTPITYNNDCE